MDRKFLLRIMVPAVVLIAAVFSLLMVLPATAEAFAWFSWAWAGCMVSGALGLAYLLLGLFSRGDVVVKKVNIYFGAAFFIVALFCLVWAIKMPKDWIAPLIAIIVAAALFLGVLVTGGRRWDAGDNQKVGYKNYYQRKEEEDKAKAKEKDTAKH